MKFPTLCLVLILTLLLLAAGCTNQQPAVQPVTPATPVPTAPSPLATQAPSIPAQLAGNWVLTTMAIQGGTAVTHPTTEINLIFNPDLSFTGYDGCNNYFGTFTLTGTTTPIGQGITMTNISASKKYCSTLADQEQQYLNILGKTKAYVVDGTQLTLTGDMGDVLIYQRPATLVTRSP